MPNRFKIAVATDGSVGVADTETKRVAVFHNASQACDGVK